MMGKAVVFSVYKDNRHESCRLFMMLFISETNSLPVGAVGGVAGSEWHSAIFLPHSHNEQGTN